MYVFVPLLENEIAPPSLLRARPLTVNLVDLGVLRQDLIRQFLGRGENLRVVHGDQVLNELLQLVSVHLEEGL